MQKWNFKTCKDFDFATFNCTVQGLFNLFIKLRDLEVSVVPIPPLDVSLQNVVIGAKIR